MLSGTTRVITSRINELDEKLTAHVTSQIKELDEKLTGHLGRIEKEILANHERRISVLEATLAELSQR